MGLTFDRAFAMPHKYTFTIKPIAELLQKYVGVNGGLWVDPFAGFHSPASETNDINPAAPTKYHVQAVDFADEFEDSSVDGILFDPPYSPRQISECYKSIGLPVTGTDTQNARLYASVRDAFVPKLSIGATAISFGWNSAGFGEKRGFEKRHILMVNHGAAHNDTICLVEEKVREQKDLF